MKGGTVGKWYAYIEAPPKARWGRTKPTVYTPRKPDEEPRWREEDWSVGTEIFTGQQSVSHHRAGVSFPLSGNYGAVYDARIVPDKAIAYLENIDNQIRALRVQYQNYVEGEFKTWPILNKEGCASVVKARYPNEKAAKATMKPPKKLLPAAQREANRQMRELSQVFTDAQNEE